MRLVGKDRIAIAVIAMGAFAGSSALIAHSSTATGAQLDKRDAVRALERDSRKARFNGALHGWRVGHPLALEKALGNDLRKLELHCNASQVDGRTATALDFTLTYLPSDVAVQGITGPDKWVCGNRALSVMYDYAITTPNGPGSLWAFRQVVGRRVIDLDAAFDRVEAGTINGRPAIFAHPAHDASGFGGAQIIVIEDNTGPEFTLLRFDSENGISFDELIKIAEGAR